MNVNGAHPFFALLFECLRKMKKTTIGDLFCEIHIMTGTYEKVKKGFDVRLIAYQSLFYYFAVAYEDGEI